MNKSKKHKTHSFKDLTYMFKVFDKEDNKRKKIEKAFIEAKQQALVKHCKQRLAEMVCCSDVKLYLIADSQMPTAYAITNFGMVVWQLNQNNHDVSEVWLTSWELTALNSHDKQLKPNFAANIKAISLR